MVRCPAAANAQLLAGTGTMRMRTRRPPGLALSRGATSDDMAYGTAHGTAYGTAMNGEAGLALASRSDAARLGSVTVRSSRTSLSVYSPC